MPEDIPKPKQLQMVWPKHRLGDPPPMKIAQGYLLRTYQPGDESGFYRIMGLSGVEGWGDEMLESNIRKVLPNGWFLALHESSGEVVATTMATHNPSDLHPFGGELGWVAGDPAHKGKGLGQSVCAAVTRRFIEAGYQNIYLKTDDWRLPAIKTYLKLGWVPFLFSEDMEGRWRAVCGKLSWPTESEKWPTSNVLQPV